MKKLSKSLFGYNCDNVDGFINDLKKQLESKEIQINGLNVQIQELSNENAELRERLEMLQKNESKVQDALISARKIADEIVLKADKQSEEKTLKMKERIKTIIDQENIKLGLMYDDYTNWVVHYNESIEKYKEMLEKQLQLVSQEKYKLESLDMSKPLLKE